MDAPSLPLMNDYRRCVDPHGLIQVNHSADQKYGDGAAVRSIDESVAGPTKNDGDDHYFGRNLRLNDAPKNLRFEEHQKGYGSYFSVDNRRGRTIQSRRSQRKK